MASDSIPEEWRPVEGWPYEVSNHGRLRRSRASGSKYAASYRTAGTYLMGSVDCYGYRKFQMVRDDGQKRVEKAHVLVATHFIGPRPTPKHQVAHGDGDPLNNHVGNLRWATTKENAADRFVHGTVLCGESSASAVLTNEIVLLARSLYRPRHPEYSSVALAKRFGVNRSTLHDAITRRWRHLE